ncbi:MAG: helix-turn-helix domain-containing protein [Polyangiaceae bacterium]
MPPLLTGELKLLSYLGGRACTWHSSYALSSRVYGRDDGSARQLVWKYASTLRKKLAKELPTLIELCHRRGYSCRQAVTTVDPDRAAR